MITEMIMAAMANCVAERACRDLFTHPLESSAKMMAAAARGTDMKMNMQVNREMIERIMAAAENMREEFSAFSYCISVFCSSINKRPFIKCILDNITAESEKQEIPCRRPLNRVYSLE
jgi:hypothetical protein